MPRARVVREIRSLRPDVESRGADFIDKQLLKCRLGNVNFASITFARQVKGAGNTRNPAPLL